MTVTAAHDIDPKTIVDVCQLEKVYSGWSIGGRRRVDALRGVTIQAVAGEVFGLLGPNGAGKTTLIKILLGVVRPSRGKASLFGESVGSAAARQRVGYLPESLTIDPHHTARSALRYYGRLSRMTSTEIIARSDRLLDLVGLAGRDKESVRRFSKGMRQRLGLAQALMHDPDLLVLDEPTDGLDPVGRSEVRKVIERLRDDGKTIFLNSHILQEVELVCSRVAILSKGKIRGSGRIDELAGDSHCKRVVMETQLPAVHDRIGGSVANRNTILACFHAVGGDDVDVEVLATNESQYRVGFNAADQAMIDHIVDNLRDARVSISRLEVKRPTLEDTFMKLVGESESPVDSNVLVQQVGIENEAPTGSSDSESPF